MPRILVLYHGRTRDGAAAAEAVAAGARAVRFMEVDVREIGNVDPKDRAGSPSGEAAPYDGYLVLAPTGEGADDHDDILAAMGASAPSGFPLAERVVATFSPGGAVPGDGASPGLWRALSARGAILVSPVSDGEGDDSLKALGRQVARVAGWVAHGLGHEKGHRH